MSRASWALGTAVAVSLAALAATASTAAPTPQFRVTITGTQTTTWAASASNGCGTVTGSGTETATYNTPRPQTVSAAALLNGLHSPLSVVVRATRRGALTATFTDSCRTTAGLCAASNEFGDFSATHSFDVPCSAPLVADTSTCGTVQTTVASGAGLYLGYGRDPGDPHQELNVQLAVERSLWGSGCPGWAPARPVGIFASPRMPLATLQARSVTVLRGEYSCPPDCSQHRPGVQLHASWSVRFERIR